MAGETSITQFHDSVCTTTVEVLWLSKKQRFYCLLLYLRPWGSANFCVPFSLVRTHDSHRGTRLDCRGNVEELRTETVAASHEWFFQDWGLALLWRTKPRDSLLRLSAFIAHFKCSRVSSQRSALTLMPLGKQSIRRGLRRSKNIVSITLPAPGMVRLSFGRGNKGCFLRWLTHFVSGSYCK